MNDDLARFETDIRTLCETLKEALKLERVRWFHEETSETLYIELEGLERYDNSHVERIAGPILEEQDLDFEEIVLLPME